jgi:hypothetical protein
MHPRADRFAGTTMLLALASGCTLATEDEGESVDESADSITHATVISETNSGAVLLEEDGFPVCSGALLTNTAVVTAKDCFENNDPAGITASMGINTVNVAEIVRYDHVWLYGELFEVAVLRLAGPLTMHGSTSGYDINFFARSWLELCTDSDSWTTGLDECAPGNGVNVRCRGFGMDEFGFIGALHEATLPVRAFTRDLESIEVGRNLAGALPSVGDSGSSCTLVSGDGQPQLIGPLAGTIGGPDRVQYTSGGPIGRHFIAQARMGHEIINVTTGRCLDIVGGSQGEHADVQQFACHQGMNQRYRILAAETNSVSIRAAHSGKCLAVGSDGFVEQQSCTGAAAQRWTISGPTSGFYNITNVFTERCLDAIGTDGGATTRTCNGTTSQRFRLPVHVPNGAFELQTPGTTRCWDVPGHSTVLGRNLQQYGCNGGTNQEYRFEEVEAGLHRIRPKYSNDLCVTIEGSSSSNAAKLETAACDARAVERFRLELIPSSPLRYRVVNAHTGKCVEGYALGGTSDLQQWTCGEHDGQHWTFRH